LPGAGLLQEVALGARFFASLPPFLRWRLSGEEAHETLRRRLERREADFLALARFAIYDRPSGPYLQLLRLTGCDYGDLEKLVRQDGVEGALKTLLDAGVYLTVDEFKGRRLAVRGSATVEVNPRLLHNPRLTFHLSASSSGSRGQATTVPVDLASVRERGVDTFLGLEARGGTGWLKAHWMVPGAGAIARILEFASFGDPPVRWFSQVDPAAPGLHPRYLWSARAMRWGSLLAGVPLPSPCYVPLDDPLPLAQWVSEVLRSGRTPHLFTFASSAVRLCRAAFESGLDLRGAQFTVTGEPLTAARRAVFERVGATAVPRYAIMECGALGFGCLAPDSPDDVHLPHDLHAVVQPGSGFELGGLPSTALLITSLRPTAPFILLNVSMGDQAELRERTCGCALEQLGWRTHLRTIRSHEKLTGEGMSILDVDVIRILEDVLPARFGGAPTDYQLVETETADGHASLRLLVDPAVGPVDPDEVTRAFLSAIGEGTGVERITQLLWSQAGLLRLERRSPFETPSGKILHLHVQRSDDRVRSART
jgi:hypothetical protein